MSRVTVSIARWRTFRAEYRSESEAPHRKWRCLHMSEKFSSMTKTPKQTYRQTKTNKQTRIYSINVSYIKQIIGVFQYPKIHFNIRHYSDISHSILIIIPQLNGTMPLISVFYQLKKIIDIENKIRQIA